MKTADAALSRDYVGYDIRLQPAPDGAITARFFVGPKHFETLRQTDAALRTDADLVRAIWFGMFAFLCVPLLSALNWVNGFIGNYGWSIIALTVIINAAMFPLRHKSNVSMRKMQAIQPQVKAIQDRVLEAESDRSRAAEDEHRDDGAVSREGCQPGERLRPDAAHLPRAARVLQPAVGSDRAAQRAVHLVDSRPRGARSVLRDARS